MAHLLLRPGLGSRPLGVPEWDWRLWNIGRQWLAANPDAFEASVRSTSEPSARRCDVYLATRLYDIGGHTALIGDFVRALDGPEPSGAGEGASSHLVLTGLLGQRPFPLPGAIQSRLGLPAAHVTLLPGPALVDRLCQLFARLLALRPQRLFLFHHPGDPLASAVAQPEIAPTRVLVHHADGCPSFGLHVPGVRIIDLSPHAAAMTRLQGRVPAWLPLTARDPGPRPHGFLRRERLVTAMCGGHHKFFRPYAFSYPETVGVILRATGGWHVHIGPLDRAMRQPIDDQLRRMHLPLDRFVHVPSTSSVAATLWDQQCDVFCASFPIDGAKTRVDVLASATPYVRHSTAPDADRGRAEPDDPGTRADLVWRTWDDLSATLQRLSDGAALDEASARARLAYDALHHPTVFADHLIRILAGGDGAEDPQQQERSLWAVQAMVRSLTAAMLPGTADAGLTAAIASVRRGMAGSFQDPRGWLLQKVDRLFRS